MRELKGRIVLVTGTSRGLGVDIARAFAAKGARLAIAARSAGELEQVRAELAASGAEVVAVPCDIGLLEECRKLVAEVERRLGPIDVLVNNAAVENVADFETTEPALLEHLLRVNVIGTAWLTRLVVPSMIARGSGHVSNIASLAGLVATPHNAAYSASKHAVVGLARSLRVELAEHGVEVSVVCPGFVRGGMFARWGRQAPKSVGSVSSAQVAEATVDAVVRNRGEVIVAPGLARISDWITAIAPDFAAAMMRRMGLAAYLREQARLKAVDETGGLNGPAGSLRREQPGP